MKRHLICFGVLVCLWGCGNNEDNNANNTPTKDMTADVEGDISDATPDDMSAEGTSLRFDPKGEFFDVPFPSDVKLDAEGRIDFTMWRKANSSRILPLWFDAIKELNQGWSPISGVFHYFDGAIDAATLPASVEASTSTEGGYPNVFLMDVDANSPERGKLMPLKCRFNAEEGVLVPANELACMSPFGVVRRFNTQYAFVVTSGLKDVKGASITQPAAMRKLLSGENVEGKDKMIDAAPYVAARDYLKSKGVEDLVSVTLFTTGDPTARLRRINTFYESLPEPQLDRTKKIQIVQTYDDYVVLAAYYNVPIIQEGAIPYERPPAGKLAFDDQGNIKQIDEQSIRVFITIPRTTMPEKGYPTLIYMHGSGGVADELVTRGPRPTPQEPPPAGSGPGGVVAKFGVAGFAADFQFHGMRLNPPDSTGLILYNLFGNPRATVDNFLIAANEVTLHARLLKGLTIDPNEVEPKEMAAQLLQPGSADGLIRFDDDRFASMGQSMGSTIGLPAMTIDKVTDAAIFSGSGGILIEIATTSMKPVDVGKALRVFLRYGEKPLDQYDAALHAVQHLWDFVDPVVHARHVVLEPFDGIPAKHVIQHSGLSDGYFTADSRAAFSLALGAPLVTPVYEPSALEVMGLGGLGMAVDPPVSQNINGVTAAVLQYEPSVLDGHNVAYQREDAQHQYGCFIKSLSATAAPVVRSVANSSPQMCP